MREGEVDGDPAAHRAADQRGVIHLEVVEELAKILDVRVLGLGFRGVAVAADVEADRPKPLGKHVDLVVPGPAVPEAWMDEHDCSSAPRLLIEESSAVNLDV